MLFPFLEPHSGQDQAQQRWEQPGKPYQAALLETDWTKMWERVQRAESEIHRRRLELSQDHGGTQEERDALVNAMSGLGDLRMNVASWLERQNLGGTLPTKPVQNKRYPYPVFDSPDKAS